MTEEHCDCDEGEGCFVVPCYIAIRGDEIGSLVVSLQIECPILELAHVLMDISMEQWRQQILDAVAASVTGSDLGLTHTERTFQVDRTQRYDELQPRPRPWWRFW